MKQSGSWTFRRLSEMPGCEALVPQTSRLIYESGADYYDTLFGSRELALARLAAWVTRTSSAFACDRITLALVNASIAGIALELSGKDLPDRQRADILHLIKETESSRRELVLQKLDMIRLMTQRVRSDEYYLRSLSVEKAFRGCGLGRALLERYIDNGTTVGFCRFRLDVRGDNLVAINLYRSVGFDISNELTVPQTGWKLCSMVLRKSK
jgi:GNAT superfamily N-acetyltransferase